LIARFTPAAITRLPRSRSWFDRVIHAFGDAAFGDHALGLIARFTPSVTPPAAITVLV
jgi:hypothetical protein